MHILRRWEFDFLAVNPTARYPSFANDSEVMPSSIFNLIEEAQEIEVHFQLGPDRHCASDALPAIERAMCHASILFLYSQAFIGAGLVAAWRSIISAYLLASIKSSSIFTILPSSR